MECVKIALKCGVKNMTVTTLVEIRAAIVAINVILIIIVILVGL